jgi:hypothetical protein
MMLVGILLLVWGVLASTPVLMLAGVALLVLNAIVWHSA